MYIAGVEVADKKVLLQVNKKYEEIIRENMKKEIKSCCSICYKSFSSSFHIIECRKTETERFLNLLRKYVKEYNVNSMEFLKSFNFSGLNSHPLDLTAVKIIKKLFILFEFSLEKSILYDIFIVLNAYNTRKFKYLQLELFENKVHDIILKSLPVHQHILVSLKTRNPISYEVALYEITELYHVNMICF